MNITFKEEFNREDTVHSVFFSEGNDTSDGRRDLRGLPAWPRRT